MRPNQARKTFGLFFTLGTLASALHVPRLDAQSATVITGGSGGIVVAIPDSGAGATDAGTAEPAAAPGSNAEIAHVDTVVSTFAPATLLVSTAIAAANGQSLPPTPAPCNFGDWGFESGESVWLATGSAFAACRNEGQTIPAARVRREMQLSAGGVGGDYWQDLGYPIGVRGRGWVSSSDSETGSLQSRVIKLSHRFVSFKLGGGASPNLFVALFVDPQDRDALRAHARQRRLGVALEAAPSEPVLASAPSKAQPKLTAARTTGAADEVARVSSRENSEELKRHWFDVAKLLGADMEDIRAVQPRVRVAVVDQDTGSAWGHINADDFRFQDEAPAVLSVQRGTLRLDFDVDHPVWGFADTHTHPAAHLGFGGRMIVGDPSRPLEQTYATQVCEDNHGGVIPAMGLGKPGLNLPIAVADPHYCLGAPSYVGYPRFNVKTYSGYHPEFFRRAFEGGERLVVALAVNNQYLAHRMLGTGIAPGTTTDDHSQMLRQIAFLKQLAADNASFMKIAYSAREARSIILEGKLAVVLGIEIDNFGNFKDQDFIWGDDAINGTLPLVTLSRDTNTAKLQLDQVIREYRAAGVRQVTGMHYIDGLFGGVPVMQPEPLYISQAYTGKCYVLAEGAPSGVAVHILEQFSGFNDMMQWLVLAGTDTGRLDFSSFIAGDCASMNSAAVGFKSTVNAGGLTGRGLELFFGLMRAGMLVDAEHTSFRTKDDLIALAAGFDYPLMSSHTDPTELAFHEGIATPGGNDWNLLSPAQRTGRYGTSKVGYLAKEFSSRDSDLAAIRDSGGTIGLFTMPWRKPDYAGAWGALNGTGRVRNNADGSSKTWAQAYLYVAERMGGRGVALASDRAGTEQLGPRFGVFAAWPLKSEEDPELSRAHRINQRLAQAAPTIGGRTAPFHATNNPWGASAFLGDVRPNQVDRGVRYDRRLASFHSWLYEFGDVDAVEEDIWKALAFIEAFPGVNPWSPAYNALPAAESVPPDQPQRVPLSGQPLHQGRIENFVRGWYAPGESALVHPGFATGDTPWEQAAFFALRNGLGPCDLTTFSAGDRALCNDPSPTWSAGRGALGNFYWQAKSIYDLWQAMSGNNAPLRRFVTGSRYWDFNLDGLGNYGLLPDFLQDLRNVGINGQQMDVLFASAEDYIRMWEKAEAAMAHVPP